MKGTIRQLITTRALLVVAVVAAILVGAIALKVWRRWRTPVVELLTMPFDPTDSCGTTGTHRTYVTKFLSTEDPISENGNWLVSGGTFANVRAIHGIAFGTQTGTKTAPAMYDDSTALLTGNWGPDQFVQIVVYHSGAPIDEDYDEVEIRLRSAISPTSNTGYEIQCRVGRPGDHGYVQVGKVNGPIGDFAPSFDAKFGREFACHHGDVLTAFITGTTIKAFLNGRQVLQANDSTYATGAPGIGLFHGHAQAKTTDYGISRVYASDRIPWLGTPCVP